MSSALGVGVARGQGNDRGRTGGEASSSDDNNQCQSTGFEEDEDEAQTLGVMEDQEIAVYSAPEPRRSERKRKATKRFEEGWLGERLPKLSLALGVAVSDRKDR